MTPIVTVMVSCQVREAARALTIPQFEAHGFGPRVFLSPCAPAGPAGINEVAHRALIWAAQQAADALFVEDDIDLAPEFAACVDLAQRADGLTYLYLNDSPARLAQHHGRDMARTIQARQPIARGAYAFRRLSALFGTQCVVIPRRLVATAIALLEAPHTSPRGEPFDGRLHLWARRTPTEVIRVVLPHPVQHRKDRTGREPTARDMRSYSYGLPVTPEPPFIEEVR